ncbi:alpha/beta fold hydrolase [Lentzea albida]|uniref:Pimeloyl-ACP methyl ester carboxylesterase n=1 Tax=Lentzea albida TaxID=65499 RepID=A0A1H9JV21_9PSEU|nr:alpha/beta hydrolase [Lentzea albida]SEQ90756.1 Pimeloyl-ACP methyl ester carboxylesterase [Lentzea albida]
MKLLPVTPSGAHAAYLDVGPRNSPTTVYLGGLGLASTVTFAPVIGHPALANAGRHVLVDLVGSGWSDHDDAFSHTIEDHAATVAKVADALDLRAVRLVGHSLGGSIAISLATRRPDLVGELVVAEPNLDPGVGTTSAQIASLDEDTFVKTGMRHLLDAEGQTMGARTLSRWSPRGLHRTAVSLLAERPATFRAQLTALTMPKRFVAGGRSGEDLDAVRATGCDVRVVPGAGHLMMDDDLDGFVKLLVGPLPPATSVNGG